MRNATNRESSYTQLLHFKCVRIREIVCHACVILQLNHKFRTVFIVRYENCEFQNTHTYTYIYTTDI